MMTVALFWLPVWLGACTSYRAPTLTIVDARVTDISDDAIVVMFTIDAQNTNDVEIPLQEAKYTLTLDGRRVFEGYRSPQATLQRRGTQRIHLPAVIPIPKDGPAPTGSHRYRLGGTLVYVTPGEFAELLFDAKLRRPKVRFSYGGTIDFDEPVESAPSTPINEQPADDVRSIPEGG